MTTFNPTLPGNADRDDCRRWYRQLVRDFGPGFHPDTPADDYVDAKGRRLPTDVTTALDVSIDRAFTLLGDELYDVGLVEIRRFFPHLADG